MYPCVSGFRKSCCNILPCLKDPAVVIDWDNYPPGQRGKDADAFVKWSSSLYIPDDQDPTCQDYMIGYVWPDTKTVFPDFFKPSTQEWWKEELRILHEVRALYLSLECYV